MCSIVFVKATPTMKFVDEATIEIAAGDGGNGARRFGTKNTKNSAAPTAVTAGAVATSMAWPIPT